MKVIEILELSDKPGRVQIIKDKEVVFAGWNEDARCSSYINEEVKQFRFSTELRHRKWRELGLAAPLEPNETPDYKFEDLELKVYYNIFI